MQAARPKEEMREREVFARPYPSGESRRPGLPVVFCFRCILRCGFETFFAARLAAERRACCSLPVTNNTRPPGPDFPLPDANYAKTETRLRQRSSRPERPSPRRNKERAATMTDSRSHHHTHTHRLDAAGPDGNPLAVFLFFLLPFFYYSPLCSESKQKQQEAIYQPKLVWMTHDARQKRHCPLAAGLVVTWPLNLAALFFRSQG
jgi:hypothetical protein